MEEKKKGLTATPLWALDEEEKKAAGWTAKKPDQEESIQKEAPVLIKRKSTVVKSPWDPMRDTPEDTVEEQIPLDSSPEDHGEMEPISSLSPVMLWVLIGLGVGAVAGSVLGGYSLAGGGVGAVLGLLAGVWIKGKKEKHN